MEQLRKVLASKLDVWALLNTYFPGAASIEEELKPAVKSFMSMMESLSQDDTVPELIMSLFQCGAMMLYLGEALAEWVGVSEDWSAYAKAIGRPRDQLEADSLAKARSAGSSASAKPLMCTWLTKALQSKAAFQKRKKRGGVVTKTKFGERLFGGSRGSPHRRSPSPVPLSPDATPPATQLSDDEHIQEALRRSKADGKRSTTKPTEDEVLQGVY